MNIFDIVLVPMGYLLRFAYSISGNYLVSILLFSLVMEIILSPIQIKQQKNQIAQAKLQPKVRAITKKYDGRKDQASMQKKQQEIMELYQAENFSPYGGCLPMLIQLPLIFALYHVITNPLKYICNVGSDTISALTEKFSDVLQGSKNIQIGIINQLKAGGGIDAFVDEFPGLEGVTLPNFTNIGIDLSESPDFGNFSILWLIPVLVFVASFASAKIMRLFTYQPPESSDVQNSTSMKIMNMTMPLLSAYICFMVPAAIGCYWIFRNIISVVEKFIISKIWPIPQPTEEELRQAEKEYGAKNKKKKGGTTENKPAVRSLHRIDFDDEPLPPPVPDDEEDEPPEISAEETPIERAPLKEDPENKK